MPQKGLRRRDALILLGGAALASSSLGPQGASAQQDGRIRRVGVLLAFSEGDPELQVWLAALRQGLEKRGWTVGRNVRIDYRFAPVFDADVPQGLAKELIALQPDVILAHGTGVASALQRESRTIPIVFVAVSDPIGSGFIASLARPGGNLTGLMAYESTITGKWLQMLKEIAPGLSRVALIANPKSTPYDYFLRAAEAAAAVFAIEVVPSHVESATDIQRAIEDMARVPNGGLLLVPDNSTLGHRDLVIALAARHRLPAVYAFRVFVADGGLMSYGIDRADMYRQAASYVDRILRGDKPADLPVQAPVKYETVLNLKTAKALGFTLPPGLLVAADEVIE